MLPCEWDNGFRLVADIDLSVYRRMEFNRIEVFHYYSFRGRFDGSQHAVSHWTYDSCGRWAYATDYVGLFCAIAASSVVKDLRVVDANVAGFSAVGGIVGQNCGGRVSGYSATGRFEGDYRVGGLTGGNEGTVTGCWAVGSVRYGHSLGRSGG